MGKRPVNGIQSVLTLSPFSTTYLCKAGFSALAMIKTQYRNQIQPEDHIRWALATIKPNFDELMKQVQGQSSHWNLRIWAINKFFLNCCLRDFCTGSSRRFRLLQK